MERYTYIAKIEGKRTVLTIESPLYTEKRYKVKACGLILGYIYRVEDLQFGSIWKSTSLTLMEFTEEIGDFIERTDQYS
ncbi:hypothetical protein [Pedobacter mucosus]|uniref:hypothetical protein n=1 Tax=Pedobacter mucosus TaxID=2895286 RepID=UPI001EE3C4DB|nr:hypothetical protein [Pedobacter mucosus]UKT63017.1 hypothetical protein LOK61_14720 [Pedobacter mucosus]